MNKAVVGIVFRSTTTRGRLYCEFATLRVARLRVASVRVSEFSSWALVSVTDIG